MATTQKKSANTSLVQKDTVDIVANKVRQFQERGELHFPDNYSPENAMKAAWLAIQEAVDKDKRPAIDVCTRTSIANALLKMVVQGLNPAKNQCYFIVYGDKLILQRSYFGAMHIAKTVNPDITDIIADVVYEGDTFVYSKIRGKTIITEHKQTLENIDKQKIKAAYCSIFFKDGREETTIMTMQEIVQSWRQSRQYPVDDKGNLKADSVHAKFTGEMAKKTVINRACKTIINASDDSNLLIVAYKSTEADIAEAEAQEEIAENANKTPLFVDTDTGEVTDEQQGSPAPAEDDLP